MKLLTEEQRTKLLANGTRRGADHKPVVKWFNPCGSGTWLVSELDPEYPDECAFGLADLGFGTPELGSIGLLELTEYRGPFGLGIERDIHFTANYPLSIYAEAARAAGHIVESGPELEAAARILAAHARGRRSFGKAGEPAATDGNRKRQDGVPPPATLNGGAATASRPRSTNPARAHAGPQAGESRCRSQGRGKGAGRPRGPSAPQLIHPTCQPGACHDRYHLRRLLAAPERTRQHLALLVEARQPVVVWGAPGCAKSQIAQQVAAQAGREYVDVRALLLDPVDLRGIPWRDGADRTRWAPPAFLPPSDADGSWLINLEELPSALPMVQAALYQLVLDRKCGEYELPEGAALIACGNREGDRGVVHRMPAPLASRFVHLEIRVDATDWCAWGAANGIAPEVLFFVSMRPELLHAFNPQSTEKAFPCPRTWEMVSNIVHRRGGLDPVAERALFRGTVGEAAAVEFSAFLQVWHELPHPRTVIDDPEGAVVPGNASALIALCGSLYRMADDINLGAIVTYATRLRREVGEFLVGSCIRREPALQHTQAFIQWAAAKTR